MSTLFITYQDVCIATREQKTLRKLETLYKQKDFINAFNLIFEFKSPSLAKILLCNWEDAIKEEIECCKECNLIDDKEEFQIKRITLKELTTIANIGNYALNTLKMKSHIAMAFTLGIYYAHYIFEGTGMYLTIDEIYNIIPEEKRTTNGYKKFLQRFFKDGTSTEVLKILSQTKSNLN